MFDLLGQMLVELAVAATPARVALVVCAVAFVALGVVIAVVVV